MGTTSSPVIINPYTTTTPTTTTTTTTVEREWQNLGSQVACDSSAGEVNLPTESGKVADLQACQKLCEGVRECQSFTFWNGGFCSLFSSECSNTAPANKAFSSMRL